MGSHSITCHPAEVTFPPLPHYVHYYVHSLPFARWQLGFVSLLFAMGDIVAPSGLCHTFLVFSFFLFHLYFVYEYIIDLVIINTVTHAINYVSAIIVVKCL